MRVRGGMGKGDSWEGDRGMREGREKDEKGRDWKNEETNTSSTKLGNYIGPKICRQR